MTSVIKVVLGLLAIWFGLLAIFRGIQYFGFFESEDSLGVVYPHIGLEFPFKEFVIDFLITILLILIIVML